MAQHAPDDEAVHFIPLISGSVAEFYIQPMLSCVGDADIMRHRSDEMAIPYGYPPPTHLPAEFHSRVGVYEIIDSEYPGYVYLIFSYLLTECTEDRAYNAVPYDRRQCASYRRPDVLRDSLHGPACTLLITEDSQSYDFVHCIRCLLWPPQAADWSTRRRNCGWPNSATVDRVVSDGCDVVNVEHRLCRQQGEFMRKFQRRLSFSRAEIVLLNSWMPVQQIVYHMLRVFVKTERLADITDSTGTKILSNYHIKTLMLWACELKPNSWWCTVSVNAVKICVDLLHSLADWLRTSSYPHYFINNCSLVDTVLDLEMGLIVNQLMSMTESWLSTWFVSNYLRKCAHSCPEYASLLFDDVSTGTKLRNAVSAVIEWRIKSVLEDMWEMTVSAELIIPEFVSVCSLSVPGCVCWISELAKIDSCLSLYFSAVAFLHVARKMAKRCYDNEMLDVLATLLGQFCGKGSHLNDRSSVLSLTRCAKLMKVVANNSRSTVEELIIPTPLVVFFGQSLYISLP